MAASSEPPDSVFVGRERELGGIRSLLDRATGGEAQALLVSGDAGVGKTALVARACADREGSSTLLVGICLPLTSMSIPFLPIRSALRGLSGVVAPPDVTGAEGEERDFTLRFDAWLDRRCDLEPVVLIVDDMQWADRSTLDALMYLMAGPSHRRLAVIATLRSGEVGVGHPLQRWLADVRRLPRTAELALGPLDRAGTAEQIQGLLATSPHQSLIDDVHRRSRGNPYFTRLMVAGLPPEARAAPAAFPADLSSAVLQSWYRLAAPTRHLATVLAVGGRAMRPDQLAEVVGAETGVETRSRLLEAVDAGTLDVRGDGAFWFHHPMSAEVLEAALGDDERHEWHRRFADLYETRLHGRALPVETAVAIADHRHRAGDIRSAYEWALTAADAAAAAAGWAEQLRLLRRAVALRSRLPDADESFEGLLQRLRAAAADAGATGDELDAVEALLARIDPDAEPLAVSELMVRRMHLRFMTGQAFIEVDEMSEAERLAATAPSSPQHALALAELAHAELWNESPNATEHAREAVAVARGAGDARALSHALTASSMAALIAEDGASAMRLAREAVTLAIAAREWWAFVHATLWEGNALEMWSSEAHASLIRARRREMVEHGGPHAYVAWLSAVEAASWLAVGAWRECDERLRVALGSDPGPLGDVAARLTAARLATLQGRQAEAESHVARAEELFADGSAFLAFEFDAVRAEVRLGSRDPEGAYQAALTGAASSGAPPTMCEWLMPLAARALADMAQSARDEGRSTAEPIAALDELVERFPHVIRDLGPSTALWDRQIAALDAMYRAERARVRAGAEEADAWTHAVEACASGQLAWEEAYSSRRAAEALFGRAHDRRAGAAMLRHGLALAKRLRARPVEKELRELATRARVSTAEPVPASSEEPAGAHGLTAREREILDLVAVGRTYSEIARTLMISEKTVSSHVSHLLAKTGTANRVELAGLVRRIAPSP